MDASADEATLVRPAATGSQTSNSAGSSPSSGQSGTLGQSNAPPYQAPGSYTPPDYTARQSSRRTWPWILAILAIVFVIFAGLGIAGALLIPGMMRASSNENSAGLNSNTARDSSPNLNGENSGPNYRSAPGNENNNDNSVADDTTPAPTDEDEVLSDLTDLEHDWTVANINADKKKLDRILADDYVDTSEGKSRGKAEYLKTITRDTIIQKWNFEDLKVSLKGDRATLKGIIRLEIRDQEGQIQPVAYQFTDKFVWRDGRWQATNSEVSQLKE